MKHVVIVLIVALRQGFIFLWYSPILFAKSWQAGTNKPSEPLKRKDPVSLIASLLGAFLYIYFLAWLLNVTNTQHLAGALKMGFLIWLGVILPTLVVHYKFLGYPWTVTAIDCGKELVAALLTVAILFIWR